MRSSVIDRFKYSFLIVIANSFVLVLFLFPLILPLSLLAIGVAHVRFLSKPSLLNYLPAPLNPLDVTRHLYKSVPLRNVIQYDSRCFKADPSLIYLPKPNSACEQSNLEYKVNISFGADGQRRYGAKAYNPLSLIVLGDSHAMGWGVSDQQVFTSHLAHKGINSLNLSVSSYGTAREIRRLIRFSESHPKEYRNVPFILFVYNPNDYGENAQELSLPGLHSADRAALLASYSSSLGQANLYHYSHDNSYLAYVLDLNRASRVVSEYWKYFYRWLLQAAARINPLSQITPLRPKSATSGVAFSTKDGPTDADLFFRLIKKNSRYFAGKTIFIVVSDDWGLGNSRLTADFIRKCYSACGSIQSVGFKILDSKETGLTEGSPSYYSVDDHLSPYGHQRLANALASRLNTQLLRREMGYNINSSL